MGRTHEAAASTGLRSKIPSHEEIAREIEAISDGVLDIDGSSTSTLSQALGKKAPKVIHRMKQLVQGLGMLIDDILYSKKSKDPKVKSL